MKLKLVSREQTRESKARLKHLVEHHGMEAVNCPTCRGMGGLCRECDGDGYMISFVMEPCQNPECPLRETHLQ